MFYGEDIVAAWIGQDTDTTNVIGSDGYLPHYAPRTTDYPFIVFQLISGDDSQTQDGTGGGQSVERIQIKCYSDDKNEARSIMSGLVDRIGRYQGTLATKRCVIRLGPNRTAGSEPIPTNVDEKIFYFQADVFVTYEN